VAAIVKIRETRGKRVRWPPHPTSTSFLALFLVDQQKVFFVFVREFRGRFFAFSASFSFWHF
jgi:hypothetical protein